MGKGLWNLVVGRLKKLVMRETLSPSWTVMLLNIWSMLVKSGVKYHYDSDVHLYWVSEGTQSFAVSRRLRLEKYFGGLQSRLEQLATEYCLDSLNVRPGDFVLDIGANVGEFAFYCSSRGAQVYTFEPEAREFIALEINGLSRFESNMVAVSASTGVQSFESRNQTGDSSLIATGVGHIVQVETTTLDDWARVRFGDNLPRIRLIKIDAEGAEPEVLAGAAGVLGVTDAVSVDCGPERGPEAKNTLPEVARELFLQGFSFEAFYPPRSVALFLKK